MLGRQRELRRSGSSFKKMEKALNFLRKLKKTTHQTIKGIIVKRKIMVDIIKK